jgi:hypothetical protein
MNHAACGRAEGGVMNLALQDPLRSSGRSIPDPGREGGVVHFYETKPMGFA